MSTFSVELQRLRQLLASGYAEEAEQLARKRLRSCGEEEESEAQSSLAEILVRRGAWLEALRPAKKALKLQEENLAAQEALTRAFLGSGQLAEARQSTEEKRRSFKEQQKKRGETWMTLMMAVVCEAEDKVQEAWSMIQEAQELCDMEDQVLLAKLHLEASRVLLAMNFLDETLLRAQQALTIYVTLGDPLGEQESLAVLSEVYSLRGVPYLAPTRPLALQLVKQMAQAVEDRKAEDYRAASKQLSNLAVSNPPISKKEKQEIFDSVLRKDQSAAAFMKANSAKASASSGAIGAGETFKGREKETVYWGYRSGGIAYGPRFRGIDFAMGRSSGGKGEEDQADAYAVYRLQDEADDWEKGLRAHPSILDSALQSGSVIAPAREL